MWEFLESAIEVSYNDHDIIFTGKRHHEIIKRIANMGYSDIYKKNHRDGFILLDKSNGKMAFLDRDEATDIARYQGISMISDKALTSEDLW